MVKTKQKMETISWLWKAHEEPWNGRGGRGTCSKWTEIDCLPLVLKCALNLPAFLVTAARSPATRVRCYHWRLVIAVDPFASCFSYCVRLCHHRRHCIFVFCKYGLAWIFVKKEERSLLVSTSRRNYLWIIARRALGRALSIADGIAESVPLTCPEKQSVFPAISPGSFHLIWHPSRKINHG